ncbi:MAG: hypothetical protein WCB49_02650 [Gammaproteobacteria bacterium]|jgi:hypothetical protein
METARPTVSRPHRSVSYLKAVACDMLIYVGIATVFMVATAILWFISLLIA